MKAKYIKMKKIKSFTEVITKQLFKYKQIRSKLGGKVFLLNSLDKQM